MSDLVFDPSKKKKKKKVPKDTDADAAAAAAPAETTGTHEGEGRGEGERGGEFARRRRDWRDWRAGKWRGGDVVGEERGGEEGECAAVHC